MSGSFHTTRNVAHGRTDHHEYEDHDKEDLSDGETVDWGTDEKREGRGTHRRQENVDEEDEEPGHVRP